MHKVPGSNPAGVDLSKGMLPHRRIKWDQINLSQVLNEGADVAVKADSY